MSSRRAKLKMVRPAGKRSPGKKLAKFFLRALLLAVLLLLLKEGYAFFTVNAILVTGTERLDREAVITASGLKTGTSMFAVRGRNIERRLLELPAVKSAAVTRRFPSSVAVSLTEREPAACILVGGVYWVADREGFIFEQWSYLAESLPVVTGVCEKDIVPGRVLSDYSTAAALAAVLQGLETVPGLEVAEFNLAYSDNLVCFTAGGLPVYLGGREKMAEKLNLVWHSLPYLEKAGGQAAYVDVQTGDRLVLVKE